MLKVSTMSEFLGRDDLFGLSTPIVIKEQESSRINAIFRTNGAEVTSIGPAITPTALYSLAPPPRGNILGTKDGYRFIVLHDRRAAEDATRAEIKNLERSLISAIKCALVFRQTRSP
jgi:hypothetical protein